MANLTQEPNPFANAAEITIAYRGASAKSEAEQLHQQLQVAGLNVSSATEVTHDDRRLGAAEVIITVVVTAAAKAVITTALKQLEEFLRARVEEKKADLDLRVEVKKPDATSKPFGFSLRGATVEAVKSFSEHLMNAVSNL